MRRSEGSATPRLIRPALAVACARRPRTGRTSGAPCARNRSGSNPLPQLTGWVGVELMDWRGWADGRYVGLMSGGGGAQAGGGGGGGGGGVALGRGGADARGVRLMSGGVGLIDGWAGGGADERTGAAGRADQYPVGE